MSTNTESFSRAVAASLAKRDQRTAIVEVSGAVVALMRKLERLEQQPQVKYVGVWRDGEPYEPGMLATSGGSLWHCNRQTVSKPGTDANWQLAVKNGSFR